MSIAASDPVCLHRDAFTRSRRRPWQAPSSRVVRGGSWNNNPQNLRSAYRNNRTADNRNNNIGFRVASTLTAGTGGFTDSPGAPRVRPGPAMMSGRSGAPGAVNRTAAVLPGAWTGTAAGTAGAA